MSLAKPSRKDRLEAKKAAREASIFARAEVRHDVIVRCRGRCEWCGEAVPPGELHHVLLGNGRRREFETRETLAMLCLYCHHDAHQGRLEVLENAVAWACRHGFREARAELERRLEKVRRAKWDFLSQRTA